MAIPFTKCDVIPKSWTTANLHQDSYYVIHKSHMYRQQHFVKPDWAFVVDEKFTDFFEKVVNTTYFTDTFSVLLSLRQQLEDI